MDVGVTTLNFPICDPYSCAGEEVGKERPLSQCPCPPQKPSPTVG
jgi:hypothetical protein